MSEEKKELTESTEDISDTLHIDKSERNLDFSGVSALAGPIGKPDPWWYRAGLGILKVVSKLLCFIAAILIDVLRSLLKVIVGIFAGIGLVFVGIGKLFRGAHRMFWDMDWSLTNRRGTDGAYRSYQFLHDQRECPHGAGV